MPPAPVTTDWPASKTARIETAEFGIVNELVAEVGLFIVRLPEITSHLTKLFPVVGEAVMETDALFCAAPDVGKATPSAVLFDVTVTWRPKAKFALTDTVPLGIVNEALAEYRLAILELENPLGGVPITSQFESA